jgi:hypothetical protein
MGNACKTKMRLYVWINRCSSVPRASVLLLPVEMQPPAYVSMQREISSFKYCCCCCFKNKCKLECLRVADAWQTSSPVVYPGKKKGRPLEARRHQTTTAHDCNVTVGLGTKDRLDKASCHRGSTAGRSRSSGLDLECQRFGRNGRFRGRNVGCTTQTESIEQLGESVDTFGRQETLLEGNCAGSGTVLADLDETPRRQDGREKDVRLVENFTTEFFVVVWRDGRRSESLIQNELVRLEVTVGGGGRKKGGDLGIKLHGGKRVLVIVLKKEEGVRVGTLLNKVRSVGIVRSRARIVEWSLGRNGKIVGDPFRGIL